MLRVLQVQQRQEFFNKSKKQTSLSALQMYQKVHIKMKVDMILKPIWIKQ